MLRGTEPVPHDQLAQGLGLKSPVQTSEALVSAKRIFLRCLREVVGQYVVTPEEIDEEINELKRILAGSFP
ncbi:MAG: hypothetical protein NTW19_13170 [Planctomycetota bacterium]|nr:hypothetical protein [Planctomycetota bacterium]